MDAVVHMFLIVATIFAIATLIYVFIDLLLDRKKPEPEREPEPEPEVQEEPVPVVVPVPVVEEVMPEIVESIVAEEADEMISDELALKTANYEEGAGQGKQGIINIGVLDQHFNANDVITLAELKKRKLISPKVGKLKILADGVLTKPLVTKSESYSIQAIKMIELTGGTVIILKEPKKDNGAKNANAAPNATEEPKVNEAPKATEEPKTNEAPAEAVEKKD